MYFVQPLHWNSIIPVVTKIVKLTPFFFSPHAWVLKNMIIFLENIHSKIIKINLRLGIIYQCIIIKYFLKIHFHRRLKGGKIFIKIKWMKNDAKNWFFEQSYTSLQRLIHNFFTFFYVNKKKVLDSRKFSVLGFRWIYMFWDVLNMIWPYLENVCLSVYTPLKFCGHCISRTNGRKLMKLYIQLHLYVT